MKVVFFQKEEFETRKIAESGSPDCPTVGSEVYLTGDDDLNSGDRGVWLVTKVSRHYSIAKSRLLGMPFRGHTLSHADVYLKRPPIEGE